MLIFKQLFTFFKACHNEIQSTTLFFVILNAVVLNVVMVIVVAPSQSVFFISFSDK